MPPPCGVIAAYPPAWVPVALKPDAPDVHWANGAICGVRVPHRASAILLLLALATFPARAGYPDYMRTLFPHTTHVALPLPLSPPTQPSTTNAAILAFSPLVTIHWTHCPKGQLWFPSLSLIIFWSFPYSRLHSRRTNICRVEQIFRIETSDMYMKPDTKHGLQPLANPRRATPPSRRGPRGSHPTHHCEFPQVTLSWLRWSACLLGFRLDIVFRV